MLFMLREYTRINMGLTTCLTDTAHDERSSHKPQHHMSIRTHKKHRYHIFKNPGLKYDIASSTFKFLLLSKLRIR